MTSLQKLIIQRTTARLQQTSWWDGQLPIDSMPGYFNATEIESKSIEHIINDLIDYIWFWQEYK